MAKMDKKADSGNKKGQEKLKFEPTAFPGVFYRESKNKKYMPGRKMIPDLSYYIRYYSHGKEMFEHVGNASDGTNPQQCSGIRGQLIQNSKTGKGYYSLKEQRDKEKTLREAEKVAEREEKAARKAVKEKDALTLQKVFEDYMKQTRRKERTVKDYESAMSTTFKEWATFRAVDITRKMVSKKYKEMKLGFEDRIEKSLKKKGLTFSDSDRKRAGAAQTTQHFRVLRAIYNYAMVAPDYEDDKGEPVIKSNPVMVITKVDKWHKVKRKNSVIKNKDLPKWFKAVQKQKPIIRDLLTVLFLTGMRKSEALGLEICNVNLNDKTLVIPQTKNDEPLILPLPCYLFKVLESRINKIREDDYDHAKERFVFPGRKIGSCLVEPAKGVQKIVKDSGVQFTLHDLRRGFISTANSLGMTSFTTKALVNHSLPEGDVTDGYITPSDEDLLKAMQKMEDRLLELAKVSRPEN